VAHTLSANKRIRQSAKRRLRNKARKGAIRIEMKALNAAIAKGDKAGAQAEFKKVQVIIDRSATRGTLHRNEAARKKSRLAKRIAAIAA